MDFSIILNLRFIILHRSIEWNQKLQCCIQFALILFHEGKSYFFFLEQSSLASKDKNHEKNWPVSNWGERSSETQCPLSLCAG